MPVVNGYKILYVLLHTLFSFVECSWITITFIYQICTRITRIVYSSISSSSCTDEVDQLQRRLSKLSKIPQHLTVIVGVEEYLLDDLANLIFWCLAIDIPFISFYDCKGNLKKQEENLQNVVDSKKPENVNIIWHTHSGMPHKNGYVGQKIHVKILTEEDGRQSIVNLTKTLALIREKNINKEKISEYLLKQYEFPDPDMAIICGKTLNIYNYPPWQLRLTEFFKIRSLCNITFSLFLENLEKYSRCEQRVGK